MDLLKTPMCQAWLILPSDMVYLLVEMISNLDRQRWNLCLLTFWSVLVWRYAVLHFPWHFLCYFYSFIYSTLVYYFFQFATCLHALPGCTINLLCTIVYCLHWWRTYWYFDIFQYELCIFIITACVYCQLQSSWKQWWEKPFSTKTVQVKGGECSFYFMPCCLSPQWTQPISMRYSLILESSPEMEFSWKYPNWNVA